MTVGFFQVMDPTQSPPKLGPEIGRSEGRQVRHRMFAIVDRTNLHVYRTTTLPTWSVTVTPATGPQPAPIQLTQMGLVANSSTGVTWQVQAGMRLVYEPGTPNEETVVVQNATPPATGFVATFTKTHPNPTITGTSTINVIQRGNPGTWGRYDPRLDPLVVLYYSIID